MQIPDTIRPTTFCFFYRTDRYDDNLDFYKNQLKLTVKDEYTTGDGRRGVIFDINGYAELEFFEPKAGVNIEPISGGLRLEVPDIDDTFSCMQDAGLPLISNIRTHSWGEKSFSVRAPDGLLVQVYALMKKQ